jgi:hypothetical protein
MPVLTRAQIEEITKTLPEVEYPEEVIQRLNREFLVAKAQMATGELKPMSAAEYAAKKGFTLDEIYGVN